MTTRAENEIFRVYSYLVILFLSALGAILGGMVGAGALTFILPILGFNKAVEVFNLLSHKKYNWKNMLNA